MIVTLMHFGNSAPNQRVFKATIYIFYIFIYMHLSTEKNRVSEREVFGLKLNWISMEARGRPLLNILVVTTIIILVLNPYGCVGSESVTVSLYYETLCPYCADFIVNHLVKLFQNGLISIVNLRMLPWGNAWLNPNRSFVCQVPFPISLLPSDHA